MSKQRIGFVGVGLMGHGMAKNLVEKGWPVTVLGHRNRAPVDDLVTRGAHEAKDVAGLVAAADIVFLCVTGTPQVEDLLLRADGILAHARDGLMVVDTSTSQPASTLRLAQTCAAKGVVFVDAPLARTPVEAEQGRLNSMVGATDAVYATLEPVLKGFCENVFHMGPTGSGHAVKLANNFVSIGTVALLAEALVACRKLGVEPANLVRLMSVGGINSGILQLAAGGAVEGDFTRMKFALSNAAKDVRYFAQAMAEVQAVGVMGPAVHQSLAQAESLGWGEKMVPSLIEAQAQLNHVKI
ncbi:MAG: NAD(P)-dependent oxidoreductase [Burkholderiales bacterium]|jgi:3-hydroxyisobutyrate dehydrogenase-like beta-hydroxyacid dehydrogenase|nr:NAD(P)-dependent oxidoreductase [Burkholderiales bacterium]